MTTLVGNWSLDLIKSCLENLASDFILEISLQESNKADGLPAQVERSVLVPGNHEA